jgi:hypothetical protein
MIPLGFFGLIVFLVLFGIHGVDLVSARVQILDSLFLCSFFSYFFFFFIASETQEKNIISDEGKHFVCIYT